MCGNFQQQIHAITQQLDWFKRQLFGQKSEKRDFAEVPQQVNMAELFGKTAAAPAESPKETITYQRGKALKNRLENAQEDTGLRFDDSVPVKEIQVVPAELKGANKDHYEIVGTKTTCRLAQKPASYVVLKYVHPVIKEKTSQALISTSAPANVLDKSIADVSLLAGLLINSSIICLCTASTSVSKPATSRLPAARSPTGLSAPLSCSSPSTTASLNIFCLAKSWQLMKPQLKPGESKKESSNRDTSGRSLEIIKRSVLRSRHRDRKNICLIALGNSAAPS